MVGQGVVLHWREAELHISVCNAMYRGEERRRVVSGGLLFLIPSASSIHLAVAVCSSADPCNARAQPHASPLGVSVSSDGALDAGSAACKRKPRSTAPRHGSSLHLAGFYIMAKA